MVDPNRKINRLTDDDLAFLNECEEDFKYRYTNEDEEFVAHCAKPFPDPPVVLNWGNMGPGGGGGDGGGGRGGGYYNRGGRGGYRNYHNNNNYNNNQRNWQPDRHNRGGYRQQRPYQQKRYDSRHNDSEASSSSSSYSYNHRVDFDAGHGRDGYRERDGGRERDNFRPFRSEGRSEGGSGGADQPQPPSNAAPPQRPMNVRRDYSNFVAASSGD